MTKVQEKNITTNAQEKTFDKIQCGLIMPIAPIRDYSEAHWQDVKRIIQETTYSIEGYSFKTEMVSDSDGETNMIHKNIIQNIYNADIVVCDISGRNPNVLFELGMRLTFDKPTVIIMDNQTDFLFDIGSIDTLIYPKDLRFQNIIDFKGKLAQKIIQTLHKYKEDKNYSAFLKHFGDFEVPTIDQKQLSTDHIILNELQRMNRDIRMIKNQTNYDNNYLEQRKSPINRSSTVKNIALSLIQTYVANYITSTLDNRAPIEIAKSKEFVEYITSNLEAKYTQYISKDEMINIIEQAQIAY
ncbi:hypothetical protein [Bacillus massiliigorillae]|uniref:hypothetical protein n=1 Tax=Bacillus massiliigorillae TaxID=1243664 RepID=UPI00039B25A0|nr:hypothetical protein [Bacillus massiliigorillae]